MTLKRHILTALKQAWLTYQYDTLADGEDGWNEEDAKRLTEFFASLTGRKLKARLTNYTLRAAAYANKQADVVRHSGIANGIELGINAIEDHFYVSQLRNADNSETTQETSVPRGVPQLR